MRGVIPCITAALLSGCGFVGQGAVLGGGSNGLPGQVLGLPGATAAQLVNAEISDLSTIAQALIALKALLDGMVLAPIPVPPPPPVVNPGGPVVTPNRR